MLSEEESNANVERLLGHWRRDPADEPVAHVSATPAPRQLCLPGFRDRAPLEPAVSPRIAPFGSEVGGSRAEGGEGVGPGERHTRAVPPRREACNGYRAARRGFNATSVAIR